MYSLTSSSTLLRTLLHRHPSTFERLWKTAIIMTSPSTISPKFLSAGNELGVVAVGFSGGQVNAFSLMSIPYKRVPTSNAEPLANISHTSANQAWTLHPAP